MTSTALLTDHYELTMLQAALRSARGIEQPIQMPKAPHRIRVAAGSMLALYGLLIGAVVALLLIANVINLGADLGAMAAALAAAVMGIAGNYLLRDPAYREQGYSAYVEAAPSTNVAFGEGEKDVYVTVVKDPNDPKAAGCIVKIPNVQ